MSLSAAGKVVGEVYIPHAPRTVVVEIPSILPKPLTLSAACVVCVQFELSLVW